MTGNSRKRILTPRKQVEPPLVDEPSEIEATEEVPTLGDLLGAVLGDEEPVLPGFEMDDDPLPTPLGRSYIEATNERAKTMETLTNATNSGPRPSPSAPVLDGEIIAATRPGGTPRYESRIRILDAWQYTGAVHTAPAYVDRNWIGYSGEYDAVREIGPGPCLRVPLTSDPNERVVTICRVGDYVVHEEIVGDNGALSEKIEVWEKGQFQRLFLPKQTGIQADARL